MYFREATLIRSGQQMQRFFASAALRLRMTLLEESLEPRKSKLKIQNSKLF
jgi:hypothetical protein